MNDDGLAPLRRRFAVRHHLAGWVALLVFLSLGLALETLHGFKVGYYLDPGHRLRREMWTLAHAHGTLLALVNIGFAAGLVTLGRWQSSTLRLASFLLLDATVLMPSGFFLGGLNPTESDPGLGILLVPVGALFFLVAVALIVRSALAGLTSGAGTPTQDTEVKQS